MNASAKVLVTLATIIALPLFLFFGLGLGVLVALKCLYVWLDFVWNDIV